MPPSSVPAFHETPDQTAVHVVTFDELESPIVKRAADYWLSLRNGRRFPAREDLHPRDMAGFLRDMALVKIIDGGADYEYRIIGDAQAQAYSVPLRGRRISEIAVTAPWFGQIAANTYEYVRRSGEPLAMRGGVGREFPEAKFVYNENVFLPLGASDDAVDHLLIVSTNVFDAFSKNAARKK
ncbi:MAG: PAS domain-containing protein [Rhizomicrobium sp.]|jgi:hypothetical protein